MLSDENDGEEFARILLSTILGKQIRKVRIVPQNPTIPYDDGAKKIFLYTKGIEGNPSNSLKDMLKYIEKSTNDNVTNQDIASIQELVNKVKRKREVGINYMKSWEMEELAEKRGFEIGFNNGFNNGFNDGFNEAKEKINQLNLLLAAAGRTDDIIKSAGDKEYQEQLLNEFNL